MRGLLVCGGRHFAYREWLGNTLDEIWADQHPDFLIAGGASGADDLARRWALKRQYPHVVHPAEWNKYGRRAGMKRNADMLACWKPTYVVAFPGGTGTQGMLNLAGNADCVTRIYDFTSHGEYL